MLVPSVFGLREFHRWPKKITPVVAGLWELELPKIRALQIHLV